MSGECSRENPRTITRMDVDTPLGVVHLAGFAQKPDHRSVIFRILSEYCGEAVTAADLEESKENPRPHFPKLDFDVNWTHSDGYCVLAYAARGSLGAMRLGVDLERFSPKRLHLAERFFSAEEAARIQLLMSVAEESQNFESAEKEFFRLWCRKEAFYKCVGGDFFEGTLRRNMQESPVKFNMKKSPADSVGDLVEVHFVDLEAAAVGAPMRAALCVAVSKF